MTITYHTELPKLCYSYVEGTVAGFERRTQSEHSAD